MIPWEVREFFVEVYDFMSSIIDDENTVGTNHYLKTKLKPQIVSDINFNLVYCR